MNEEGRPDDVQQVALNKRASRLHQERYELKSKKKNDPKAIGVQLQESLSSSQENSPVLVRASNSGTPTPILQSLNTNEAQKKQPAQTSAKVDLKMPQESFKKHGNDNSTPRMNRSPSNFISEIARRLFHRSPSRSKSTELSVYNKSEQHRSPSENKKETLKVDHDLIKTKPTVAIIKNAPNDLKISGLKPQLRESFISDDETKPKSIEYFNPKNPSNAYKLLNKKKSVVFEDEVKKIQNENNLEKRGSSRADSLPSHKFLKIQTGFGVKSDNKSSQGHYLIRRFNTSAKTTNENHVFKRMAYTTRNFDLSEFIRKSEANKNPKLDLRKPDAYEPAPDYDLDNDSVQKKRPSKLTPFESKSTSAQVLKKNSNERPPVPRVDASTNTSVVPDPAENLEIRSTSPIRTKSVSKQQSADKKITKVYVTSDSEDFDKDADAEPHEYVNQNLFVTSIYVSDDEEQKEIRYQKTNTSSKLAQNNYENTQNETTVLESESLDNTSRSSSPLPLPPTSPIIKAAAGMHDMTLAEPPSLPMSPPPPPPPIPSEAVMGVSSSYDSPLSDAKRNLTKTIGKPTGGHLRPLNHVGSFVQEIQSHKLYNTHKENVFNKKDQNIKEYNFIGKDSVNYHVYSDLEPNSTDKTMSSDNSKSIPVVIEAKAKEGDLKHPVHSSYDRFPYLKSKTKISNHNYTANYQFNNNKITKTNPINNSIQRPPLSSIQTSSNTNLYGSFSTNSNSNQDTSSLSYTPEPVQANSITKIQINDSSNKKMFSRSPMPVKFESELERIFEVKYWLSCNLSVTPMVKPFSFFFQLRGLKNKE